MEQLWTGSFVTASHAAIVVRYVGPTDHRCSRWIATCRRGRPDETYRATASFQDGPIAAAKALLAQYNLTWELVSVGSICMDTYVVTTR